MSLVIWLAFLLSAALTSVGVQFPFLAAEEAAAATNLTCGSVSCGSTTPQDFSYLPPSNSWIVVGARSTTQSNNPRVCLYADAAFTQLRNCSSTGTNSTVEFAVVDHHHTAVTTDYARTDRISGSGEMCTQLECGAATLTAGAAPVNLTWSSAEIVRVFNLPVVAGQSYHVYTVNISGNADLGMALFDSHGQANYSAGRGLAVEQADIRGAGQGEGIVFEASATDTLGLVLWSNSAAGNSNYRIEFRTDTELVAGSPQSFAGTAQKNFFAVPQGPRSWSVVALKPTFSVMSSDADVRLYDAPDYLGQLARSSAEAGVVDFTVANYANVPEDTAYVLMISLGPLGNYTMDWEYGSPTLAPAVTEPITFGGRVGMGRVITLVAGIEYQFVFDPVDGSGGDVAVGLYGPRVGKVNFTYGTRADSIAGSDAFAENAGGWDPGEGVEEFLFTPTFSGQYFIYMYQKKNLGVSGGLRFFPTSLIGVGPGTTDPAVALSAAWPSPARAGTTVHFRCTLAQALQATLTIVDARGRQVRRVFEGPLSAGTTTLSWDGRNEDGKEAGAGIYFVRLMSERGNATRRVARF